MSHWLKTLSSTQNDFFKWLRLPHSYECSAVKSMYPLPDFALSRLGLVFAP